MYYSSGLVNSQVNQSDASLKKESKQPVTMKIEEEPAFGKHITEESVYSDS